MAKYDEMNTANATGKSWEKVAMWMRFKKTRRPAHAARIIVIARETRNQRSSKLSFPIGSL